MRHVVPFLLVSCATTVSIDDPSTRPVAPPDGSPTGSSSSPGSTPSTETTTPSTPTTPSSEAVRFVALGDAGEGNEAQFAVADAIEATCAVLGCDFALYLGDNFYDTGVDGVHDDQFQTKFEDPYEHLDFPFYVVMGNHDLGFNGVGLEFWKAPYYVDYTTYSTKWTMPDTHYSFEWGNVGFYALNTTDIFFGLGGDQERWLLDQYDQAGPHVEWRIAFGHHPYISNGAHGNAGHYEGIADWIPLTEIPRGEFVQEFMEDAVCGRVDLYLAGHDHTRQWLEPACGTGFIVTGAGAKTTDLERRDNNLTLFEDDQEEGFLWVEIDGNRLTAKFFDGEGNEDFSSSYVK